MSKGERELIIVANGKIRHGKKVVRTNCKGDLLVMVGLQNYAVAIPSVEFTTTSICTHMHIATCMGACMCLYVCIHITNISHVFDI